jgi:hypothetical protein
MSIASARRSHGFSTGLSMAGHDFWLTRCGHGGGFWEGTGPSPIPVGWTSPRAFGNVDLYVGDDGLIYL